MVPLPVCWMLVAVDAGSRCGRWWSLWTLVAVDLIAPDIGRCGRRSLWTLFAVDAVRRGRSWPWTLVTVADGGGCGDGSPWTWSLRTQVAVDAGRCGHRTPWSRP